MSGNNDIKYCCLDWKENMSKIDNIFLILSIHNIIYDGKQFKYCPWCGKEIEKHEVNKEI